MNNYTVEATELTRLYGGREAVSNVSFTLSKGQVLGFLGPNGAGKSTTMKMLTGNLAPSNGSVKICGIDMIAVSYTHLDVYKRQALRTIDKNGIDAVLADLRAGGHKI